MRKFIFIFLLISLCDLSIGQTGSDSLYFTKLYPLDNHQLLLIGSETSGSFRKCVLRHYDENLQIQQQRYERSMRNSDVFLDKEFGDQLRVISRYRWNKGKVFIYGNKLELSTVRFFKRDDYKDWKITDDESFDYPVERGENLRGLNPIFYDKNLCYYFSEATKEAYLYEVDFSYIKPRFTKISTFSLVNFGEITNYKWLKTDVGIKFYYNLTRNGDSKHFILSMESESKSIEIPVQSKYTVHVSDVIPDGDLLLIGGSYAESKEKTKDGFIKYQGNFAQIFELTSERNGYKLISESFNGYENPVENSIVGSRMSFHTIGVNSISFLFENMNIETKEVNMNDGMELKGSYHVYQTKSVSVISYNKDNKQFKIKNRELTYGGDHENDLAGNQGRTFHELKGQKQHHLLFNGNKIYNYNDPFVEHVDFNSGLLIYGDRNYNYYQLHFLKENSAPFEFEKNLNKRKCYFYENFYVRYYKTDWGFKLEKINY